MLAGCELIDTEFANFRVVIQLESAVQELYLGCRQITPRPSRFAAGRQTVLRQAGVGCGHIIFVKIMNPLRDHIYVVRASSVGEMLQRNVFADPVVQGPLCMVIPPTR